MKVVIFATATFVATAGFGKVFLYECEKFEEKGGWKECAKCEKCAGTIAAYFEKGGQCLHLNCFDSSVLRDAREHPERYPDLQVRVCGWNVLWRNLSRVEQDHFIATAEAQE